MENGRDLKSFKLKVSEDGILLIVIFFLLTRSLFTLLKGVVIFLNRDKSLSSDSSVSPS